MVYRLVTKKLRHSSSPTASLDLSARSDSGDWFSDFSSSWSPCQWLWSIKVSGPISPGATILVSMFSAVGTFSSCLYDIVRRWMENWLRCLQKRDCTGTVHFNRGEVPLPSALKTHNEGEVEKLRRPGGHERPHFYVWSQPGVPESTAAEYLSFPSLRRFVWGRGAKHAGCQNSPFSMVC